MRFVPCSCMGLPPRHADAGGSPMKLADMVCAGALLLLAGGAAAQDGGKPIQKTTISLGTATQGGGFPLYGNAFAEVMADADPTLSIQPRNTKGSSENIPMLEAGQLDLALVAGESFYQALEGIGRPRVNLRILTAIYSSAGMFAVRGDISLPDHSGSRRQADRIRRQGFRHSDPVALHARRDRIEAGRGFQIHLPRSRRRRAGDGARWTGRGAVGSRHRLSRIHHPGEKSRGRQVHRADRR